MMRMRHLAMVLALAAPLAQAAGAQEAAEPWGYIYLFGTLEVVSLTDDEIRLGRLPENHVTLTSPRVSRRHAAIRRTPEGFEVLDVGSSNGSHLNGNPLRARSPAPLKSGDRIQLADELLLFHRSLDSLWSHELRLRLLAGQVTLRLDLPQDYTRKSLGRETIIPVSTDATLNPSEGRVDVDYHHPIDPAASFAKDSDAFVGNLRLVDGVLELSLWAIDDEGAMTSRRSSISRLKHTLLRVGIDADSMVEPTGEAGPWFPQRYLANLVELHPEDRELSLRFSRSLAAQDRPVALRDAAATLAFRHRITAEETELLTLAVRSQGEFVERTCIEKKMSLTEEDREHLALELDKAAAWLEEARAKGARGKTVADAESAVERARTRLSGLSGE